MGKNPAFQFYVRDWAIDLEEHPLEIEGAWIRIICKLWWEPKRGRASKTIEQWAAILRVDCQNCVRILNYISHANIADVRPKNVSSAIKNGTTISIKSRRMMRDTNVREKERLRKTPPGKSPENPRKKTGKHPESTPPFPDSFRESSGPSSVLLSSDLLSPPISPPPKPSGVTDKKPNGSDVDYIGLQLAKLSGTVVDNLRTWEHPDRPLHKIIVDTFPWSLVHQALATTQDNKLTGEAVNVNKYFVGCLKKLAEAHKIDLPEGWAL